MIASYKDEDTERFAMGVRVRRFVPFERVALRKIRQLQVCAYSIRVNERYRVCFEWRQEMAWNVEIVDYHK